MNCINWKKILPVAAVCVALCITALYITNNQNQKRSKIKEKESDSDERKDEKESEWMAQIDVLKKELQSRERVQKESFFNVNDEIEIYYNRQWRKAVIKEIMEAIQVCVKDENHRDKIESIIIDNEKEIFCDCYDVCQVKNKSKHKIRFDNKQSRWGKSIKNLFDNKQSRWRILKQELIFYRKCSKYWNKITQNDEIDINKMISYYTYKYNQFMMNIATFIQQKGIKKNIKASNYVFDNFFLDKQIDLNIIYFWRIHMMHPFLYQSDCIKHFGFILSPTFHEYITNTKDGETVDLNYNDNELYKLELESLTEFNFTKSLKKNLVFMDNILKTTKNMTNFNNNIADYKTFLYYASFFMNKSKKKEYNKYIDLHLCPLIMGDFIWHTHLLFPDQYFEESARYTDGNIVLDHRDLVPEKELKQHLEFSSKFWEFIQQYKDKLRSNNDGAIKKEIAKMIVETEYENNKKILLVLGYLARIDKTRKYTSDIWKLCLHFYSDQISWNNDKIDSKYFKPSSRIQNCSGCCM